MTVDGTEEEKVREREQSGRKLKFSKRPTHKSFHHALSLPLCPFVLNLVEIVTEHNIQRSHRLIRKDLEIWTVQWIKQQL